MRSNRQPMNTGVCRAWTRSSLALHQCANREWAGKRWRLGQWWRNVKKLDEGGILQGWRLIRFKLMCLGCRYKINSMYVGTFVTCLLSIFKFLSPPHFFCLLFFLASSFCLHSSISSSLWSLSIRSHLPSSFFLPVLDLSFAPKPTISSLPQFSSSLPCFFCPYHHYLSPSSVSTTLSFISCSTAVILHLFISFPSLHPFAYPQGGYGRLCLQRLQLFFWMLSSHYPTLQCFFCSPWPSPFSVQSGVPCSNHSYHWTFPSTLSHYIPLYLYRLHFSITSNLFLFPVNSHFSSIWLHVGFCNVCLFNWNSCYPASKGQERVSKREIVLL